MNRALNIVHLEDNPRDAQLVQALLDDAGINCHLTVVHSATAFEQALQRSDLDLIISDFSMPAYDGLSALKLAKHQRPDVPFLFVSGKIGEEAAIESLKSGASDYLIKDRLARLPAAVIRIVAEIEERKKRTQAELALREHEEKLLRTQRLESLGTLAGGIAHDLNNVLLPVLLGIEVLRDKLPNTDDQEMLTLLKNNILRGTSMVKQVLTFARGMDGRRILMNPAHVIREIVEISRRTIPAHIVVRSDVPRDLFTIEGDATQIHQVLLNLVVNARDAMENGGTLTISAKNVDAGHVSHRFVADKKFDDYVLIEVADTGSGIPKEIRERVFEPFFTTKEIGKGTGLGLSTTLGIIQSHGGFIDFDTETARGTTFRLYLPGLKDATATEQTSSEPASLSGGAKVVLLVDDEPGIRELTKLVLGKHSYQVLTAENGAEALILFKRFRDRIDAVVLDNNMPLMTGPEAVGAMKEINPATKVIGTSGQSISKAQEEFMGAGADAFLAKPYTAEQLLNSLAVLLNH
jgi:two-component system cell cycle sensor histidine kinase/response regulator CckA